MSRVDQIRDLWQKVHGDQVRDQLLNAVETDSDESTKEPAKKAIEKSSSLEGKVPEKLKFEILKKENPQFLNELTDVLNQERDFSRKLQETFPELEAVSAGLRKKTERHLKAELGRRHREMEGEIKTYPYDQIDFSRKNGVWESADFLTSLEKWFYQKRSGEKRILGEPRIPEIFHRKLKERARELGKEHVQNIQKEQKEAKAKKDLAAKIDRALGEVSTEGFSSRAEFSAQIKQKITSRLNSLSSAERREAKSNLENLIDTEWESHEAEVTKIEAEEGLSEKETEKKKEEIEIAENVDGVPIDWKEVHRELQNLPLRNLNFLQNSVVDQASFGMAFSEAVISILPEGTDIPSNIQRELDLKQKLLWKAFQGESNRLGQQVEKWSPGEVFSDAVDMQRAFAAAGFASVDLQNRHAGMLNQLFAEKWASTEESKEIEDEELIEDEVLDLSDVESGAVGEESKIKDLEILEAEAEDDSEEIQEEDLPLPEVEAVETEMIEDEVEDLENEEMNGDDLHEELSLDKESLDEGEGDLPESDELVREGVGYQIGHKEEVVVLEKDEEAFQKEVNLDGEEPLETDNEENEEALRVETDLESEESFQLEGKEEEDESEVVMDEEFEEEIIDGEDDELQEEEPEEELSEKEDEVVEEEVVEKENEVEILDLVEDEEEVDLSNDEDLEVDREEDLNKLERNNEEEGEDPETEEVLEAEEDMDDSSSQKETAEDIEDAEEGSETKELVDTEEDEPETSEAPADLQAAMKDFFSQPKEGSEDLVDRERLRGALEALFVVFDWEAASRLIQDQISVLETEVDPSEEEALLALEVVEEERESSEIESLPVLDLDWEVEEFETEEVSPELQALKQELAAIWQQAHTRKKLPTSFFLTDYLSEENEAYFLSILWEELYLPVNISLRELLRRLGQYVQLALGQELPIHFQIDEADLGRRVLAPRQVFRSLMDWACERMEGVKCLVFQAELSTSKKDHRVLGLEFSVVGERVEIGRVRVELD
jgi:hypothetical protein